MVLLKQTNKFCRIGKGSEHSRVVYCTGTDGNEHLLKIYLGFVVDVTDLPKLVYKPNPYWYDEIVAVSNSVYLDKAKNECFVTVYTYDYGIATDTKVGTIECVDEMEFELTEYTLDKKAPIANLIVDLIVAKANGNTGAIKSIKLVLNMFESVYGYSWLNTAVMLVRRNYIELDESGEPYAEYKWLFDELEGFVANDVLDRLKEWYVNGEIE